MVWHRARRRAIGVMKEKRCRKVLASPVNVRELASVNTTCLNPPTAEFCPRPRVLMSYGREVQRNIWLHTMVKRLCMPKFNGCRIPAKTSINVEVVSDIAREYLPPGNHKGAREFPEAIDENFRKECELGAPLEPFDCNLLSDFLLAVSPLNSVPKAETSERRVILALSFPMVRGINDAIERSMFLGEPYKLRLSGMDDIHRKGTGVCCLKEIRHFSNLLLIQLIWTIYGLSGGAKYTESKLWVYGHLALPTREQHRSWSIYASRMG